MKHRFSVFVRRELVDHISVTVEADDRGVAEEKAVRAALTHPNVQDSDGVPFVYIENRQFVDSELKEIHER